MINKASICRKNNNNCAAILKPLLVKVVKCETTFFITFPQGFPIFKYFGHTPSGSGGKKTFKRYLKSEHTDKHTHRQTNTQTDRQHMDKSTYRKHRPRGPML